jgi:signal transduction histidine kinase
VVEPPEIETNTNASTIILEEVLVDGMPVPAFKPITAATYLPRAGAGGSSQVRIGPGKHRIELHYTSPQPGAPEQARFRYRMEGLDPDWVEAGSARTAVYSYLPPGGYRFLVSATGVSGESTQTEVELSVAAYPWQRGWVVGVALTGLLLAIVSGVRFAEKRKLNRHLRQLQEENALERERTRIAQDLHDEMGAKLCRISFLSEHAGRLDPGSREIKQQIATIADDSRELLHSLDEIVWVVNPHNDTLEHVVSYLGQYAQDYFTGTGIECELDISRELPQFPLSSQTRHHLFLAANEAFTNVLKHSGASHVKVAISCQGPALNIQVADDGRGFSTSASPNKISGNGESGNGLVNMHQRMTSVGGQCRVNSTPGSGTTVQFSLEISNSSKKGAQS